MTSLFWRMGKEGILVMGRFFGITEELATLKRDGLEEGHRF